MMTMFIVKDDNNDDYDIHVLNISIAISKTTNDNNNDELTILWLLWYTHLKNYEWFIFFCNSFVCSDVDMEAAHETELNNYTSRC